MRRQKVEMRTDYWLLPLLCRLALLAMAVVAVAAAFFPVLHAVVVVSFTLVSSALPISSSSSGPTPDLRLTRHQQAMH
eukprot:3612653-Rhodomonas_salina.6